MTEENNNIEINEEDNNFNEEQCKPEGGDTEKLDIESANEPDEKKTAEHNTEHEECAIEDNCSDFEQNNNGEDILNTESQDEISEEECAAEEIGSYDEPEPEDYENDNLYDDVHEDTNPETKYTTEEVSNYSDFEQSEYDGKADYDNMLLYSEPLNDNETYTEPPEESKGEKSYTEKPLNNNGRAGTDSDGKKEKRVEKKYVTKSMLVLVLIAAIVVSAVMSSCITMLAGKALEKEVSRPSHSTDYTLEQSDETLSFKSVIKKAQNSVVSITTESMTTDIWAQNYVTKGAGSGVIIQSDGYIITCAHVVEDAQKITVRIANDKKDYSARLIGTDEGLDIAVIKIDAEGLQEATYGDSSKLEVGDQVVAIGNPLGELSGTATTGIISALNRELTIDSMKLDLLQTDASINPGNSGGGLFDASGNLIGIVEAKSTGSDIDGLGFATPVNKAAEAAKKIISSDDGEDSNSLIMSETPIIGVTITAVENEMAQFYGYAYGGLLVREVSSREAEKAGIRVNDIIYAADGHVVSTMEDLSDILSSKKAGDKIKLKIADQNGKTRELTTKLISGLSA